MLNLINDSLGIFYDSFKNQKHKEVKLNNEYYYLVDTQEYIGNKIDDETLQNNSKRKHRNFSKLDC